MTSLSLEVAKDWITHSQSPLLPSPPANSNMAEEPEDKSFFQDVLEEEGVKNRNVLLSYVNILGGAAKKVKNMADVDVWPDVHRVNNLVDTWTVVGYCVGAFSVVGTLYFSLKTCREINQWRTWMKFRRSLILKGGKN